MMEPAEMRDRDNGAIALLNGARQRRVAVQRQVRPRLIVVDRVALQPSAQVALTERDDVIRALTPDRADDPFRERILPRRLPRADDVRDSEKAQRPPECSPVDAVAIAVKVLRHESVARERFEHLPPIRPLGGA